MMALCCVLLLAACDDPDFSCSSSKTKTTVLQIINPPFSCAADFETTYPETSAAAPNLRPVVYKVEKADDGHLYVTVLN
jgi:hypothetical protein